MNKEFEFDEDAMFDGESTPDPNAHLITQRQNELRNKLSGMGIRVSQTPPIYESSGSNNTPVNIFQKIENIKRGGLRKEMSSFDKKMDAVDHARNPHIPVPRKKKPGAPQQTPSEHAIPVEKFQPAPKAAELREIESMFEDSYSYSPAAPGNSGVPGVDFPTLSQDVGGSVDITQAFKARLDAKKKQLEAQQIHENPEQQVLSSVVANGTFDYNKLTEIVEKASRKAAEETLKKVIKEFSVVFSQMQKKQNTYEVYNSEKGIIKIGDKLYALKPVVIKKS